jgi:hypothetical protein
MEKTNASAAHRAIAFSIELISRIAEKILFETGVKIKGETAMRYVCTLDSILDRAK